MSSISSSMRNTTFAPTNLGNAPVTNAAPSRDPVDLAKCLNALAMQGLLWYGGYKSAPAPAQFALRSQLVQTIASWYSIEACPSVGFMMDSLDRRLSEWNMGMQEWLVQPLYMSMYPRTWPWN